MNTHTTIAISFERAFGLFARTSFTPRFRLIDPDQHECGWSVRPITVNLIGGHQIKACYGCGGCWQVESPAPLVHDAA